MLFLWNLGNNSGEKDGALYPQSTASNGAVKSQAGESAVAPESKKIFQRTDCDELRNGHFMPGSTFRGEMQCDALEGQGETSAVPTLQWRSNEMFGIDDGKGLIPVVQWGEASKGTMLNVSGA